MMKATLIRINLICFLFILFFPDPTSAGLKTFIKEYTYQASEFDSKASSRILAMEQVKRLLLEEMGTYLVNNTEVKNYKLTKDKITTLTAGVVHAQVIDEKWDGKNYWLKAMIKADPDNVVKSIDDLRRDYKRLEDLEERIRKQNEALKEIEVLRKEVSLLKNKTKAQEQFKKSIGILETKIDAEYFGMTVQEITPEIARHLGIEFWSGVIVVAIKDGSPADEKGLLPYDIILQVYKEKIFSLKDYRREMSKSVKKKVLILLKRGKTKYFVFLPY